MKSIRLSDYGILPNTDITSSLYLLMEQNTIYLIKILKELKVYVKNKYIRFKENTIYGKRNNFPNYD